jgi:preprotein translocase subunit YajC
MLTAFLLAASQAWAAAPAQQTADGAPAQQGGGAQMIFIMVGFIAIFYFLLLRPQKKQQRERQNMLDSVKKGDRVQTSGGLLGMVTAVDRAEITLRIAPEVRVKIARAAVAAVLKPGEAPAPDPADKGSSDKGSSDKPKLLEKGDKAD